MKAALVIFAWVFVPGALWIGVVGLGQWFESRRERRWNRESGVPENSEGWREFQSAGDRLAGQS